MAKQTYQKFDIVNGKQMAIMVVPLLCFLLAIVAVASRWYTRSVRRVNTLTEDALMLAALIMSFSLNSVVYTLVFLGGIGLTTDEIKQDPTKDFDDVRRYWIRLQFALDICWATSVATVQLAFVQSYLRLYERKKFARNCCYMLMVWISAWYIWAILRWIAICHPPGECRLQSKESCIAIGTVHVWLNIVIILAPLPAVFAAQLSPKKKWSLFALFVLGCFCTTHAILRLDCAFNVFGEINDDPIGASWWRIYSSPIEVALGIICCCVSTVRSLPSWRRHQNKMPSQSTGLRRLKFRTASTGSSTSNLNAEPSHWMPQAVKPQTAAFVTLSSKVDGIDEAGSLGANEIKVTREYNLDRL
ncbi:hypothetical protein BDW02DRAFT_22615 [Decorospora gaudefroyi]|uniref:Rhodopsin domain-containing protein n=1 Tax=Decorospora gaudefroyi TaxID=184978 RepID=A0A6A5KB82_9PLEO|nr:hypothetical protein BDW02DRAFT_22615 [Decorospora gaudefroyi]